MKDSYLWLKNAEGSLVTKVQMTKNQMFMLNLTTDMPICLQAYVKDADWLWHMRFGHLNFNDLKHLSQNKLVEGLLAIN